jgi:F-box/WD-40 domain protein 2
MEKMIAAHSIADLKFDEEYLYTASYDNSAAVWSFATESMYCLYAGHINGVMSIDVNRGDNLVLTGSADYSVKVWDFHSGHMLNNN